MKKSLYIAGFFLSYIAIMVIGLAYTLWNMNSDTPEPIFRLDALYLLAMILLLIIGLILQKGTLPLVNRSPFIYITFMVSVFCLMLSAFIGGVFWGTRVIIFQLYTTIALYQQELSFYFLTILILLIIGMSMLYLSHKK